MRNRTGGPPERPRRSLAGLDGLNFFLADAQGDLFVVASTLAINRRLVDHNLARGLPSQDTSTDTFTVLLLLSTCLRRFVPLSSHGHKFVTRNIRINTHKDDSYSKRVNFILVIIYRK